MSPQAPHTAPSKTSVLLAGSGSISSTSGGPAQETPPGKRREPDLARGSPRVSHLLVSGRVLWVHGLPEDDRELVSINLEGIRERPTRGGEAHAAVRQAAARHGRINLATGCSVRSGVRAPSCLHGLQARCESVGTERRPQRRSGKEPASRADLQVSLQDLRRGESWHARQDLGRVGSTASKQRRRDPDGCICISGRGA